MFLSKTMSGWNSEWWPNHRWSRSHASTT